MIEFKQNTPTIEQVYQYTYREVESRFDYSERDILPSRFTITTRKQYKKNKEGKYTTPEEMIVVKSWSAPQYYPYTKLKSKKTVKRQLTVKHNYDIILCIQPTSDGTYSYHNSKIIWRVGSLKKWKQPKQKEVKTIFRETHDKLKKKYTDKNGKVDMNSVKKEEDKIRKTSKYLDVGDYNSQVNGINGDNYFRNYHLQQKFNCLYGKNPCDEPLEEYDFPFFCKHMISVLNILLHRKIIKI